MCSNPWPDIISSSSNPQITPTYKPLFLIATSSNYSHLQTTTPNTYSSPRTTSTLTRSLVNLPADPSGRPYTIVTEIMNAATGTETSSPSKGIMLVEPSEQAGGGAVSAAGTGVTVLALDVTWVVVALVGVVCGLMVVVG